ncbi:hypothetical protein HanRHA438_Chr03g0144141 [Helianthus annuus]|nr:hypothetical protein HanHA300_Chr03g0110461 [Helianthus annuus]KAJ0609663.1 hypothetical protein HanHA89_Chr03g0122421 [Helianthus annuus]KAJ0769712.1 hypothetical protein HanLR1_Chr03g0115721 [Helianthus annuus]KAJ0937624.1 hypothetical protein HanRHA438_Chr03g0144141 [Helianthus annuus]
MSICSSNHWVVNWSMEKFITRTILRTKVSDSSYVKETVGYNYFHINYCYFNMQLVLSTPRVATGANINATLLPATSNTEVVAC